MNLVLPIPPSPNTWPSHSIARQVKKDIHRREVWMAAIAQHRPTMDPPVRVVVHATFHLARTLRDEDNLRASLKWTLDALRQVQQGDVRWRWWHGAGVYHECGYFLDDDPAHMTLGRVEQVRVRTKKEERLLLRIEDVTTREAA